MLNRVYADLLDHGRLDGKPGGLSPRSVRYVHTVLGRSLGDAARWERIVRNPVKAATPPRAASAKTKAPEMRTSDADTLSRFLDAERNSRYRVAFPFLATTVRRELDWARSTGRQADERARPGTPDALIGLTERRRKLLELHYAGRISAELFAEEEGRLTRQINALWMESHAAAQEADELDDLEQRFQEVLELLQDLDLERVWAEASQQERRVLIDELVDRVAVYPDHLEVTVHGVPTLNVLLSEVGLRESENARVGGGT